MEAMVRSRFQRYGARKVNQALGQIRGKSLWNAYQILPQVPRISAVMILKAVKSAQANLNVKAGKALDPKRVFITSAWAGLGPMGQLKRVKPAPQGRAMTFRRKMCHLTIVVSEGA